MTDYDDEYLALLGRVLNSGSTKTDRTGTGTRSLCAERIEVDLTKGFPLLTTKFTNFRPIKEELLWFLRGETNVNTLQSQIWNEWVDRDGSIGPMYGKQWRNWGSQGIDQITSAIDLINTDPDSRRIVVSAWNVDDLPGMALAPCHAFFQFYVADGDLSCLLHQRSADIFLGLPFNVASYALLTHMIAQITETEARRLVINIGDAHLYENHVNQAMEQLSRKGYSNLPTLKLNDEITDIDDFRTEDIAVRNYLHDLAIPATIAV